ncbi:hypothetical protein Ancab_011851 [Ancistrocladus abbreviatus]
MAMMRDKTWGVTLTLCGIWTASLLYGEMFAYWLPSLSSCSWPHLHPSTSSLINDAGHPGNFVKVAVLTDPQFMDKTSIHLAPKSLALEVVQFYTDLYMRRAFLSSILPFKPDVILFLGDYFDGGPILSNEEWQESLSRFKHVFDLNERGRTKDMKVYYIPGNHDIGYAGHLFHNPEILERYEKEFGARNYQFKIGQIDFIAIDAQTVDGSLKGSPTSRTWDFVQNVSKALGSNPRVLLTHIPLYRPDWTSCGPNRYSPVINQRIARSTYHSEIVYQNYISEESSKKLLDLVQPVLILSGHDHDQCTAAHMTANGPVTEHTVGTISWQQGNLYPSFMLLSASRPSTLEHPNTSASEAVIATHLCFLPNQTFIYIWYLILFVVTILLLLLWPKNGVDLWHHFIDFLRGAKGVMGGTLFRTGTKEKIEDENSEYLMVWDAEGSMHLVKVAMKPSSSASRDMGLMDRGNTVMRPTRRQMNQEEEFPLNVNIDDAGLDSRTRFVLSRPSKSTGKMVIHRLLRTVLLALFIAVVNVPLYMMLLLKDWIDH